MTKLFDGTYISVEGFIIQSDSQDGIKNLTQLLEDENFIVEGELKAITSDDLENVLDSIKADLAEHFEISTYNKNEDVMLQLSKWIKAENSKKLTKILTYPEYITEVFISEIEHQIMNLI